MDRSLADTLLLAWVACFFLLEGALLKRRTWLGWVMLAKCLALAAIFAYAVAVGLHHPLREVAWLGGVIRLGLALAVTAAVAGLIWYRVRGIPVGADEVG